MNSNTENTTDIAKKDTVANPDLLKSKAKIDAEREELVSFLEEIHKIRIEFMASPEVQSIQAELDKLENSKA